MVVPQSVLAEMSTQSCCCLSAVLMIRPLKQDVLVLQRHFCCPLVLPRQATVRSPACYINGTVINACHSRRRQTEGQTEGPLVFTVVRTILKKLVPCSCFICDPSAGEETSCRRVLPLRRLVRLLRLCLTPFGIL